MSSASVETDEEPGESPAAADSGERIAVLKHRRASRWMHWINFPLLTIMIWSGLRIYWADVRDPFGFGVGLVGWHWFDFLPDFINDPLGLERKLARGLAFHFTFGWLFTLNGVAYAIYTWRSREYRHLLPDRHSLKDAVQVTKHDMFMRSKPMPPQGRYNGAQRLSYSLIVGLGGIAVLTGFAIYRPTQLNILTTLFGGYESARTIHFFVTISFLVFFVIHIMQVVRAGWANFASMVTGYELLKPGAEHPATRSGPTKDSDPESNSESKNDDNKPGQAGDEVLTDV